MNREEFAKEAAMPLDGEANPLKNGKTNKNGVLNECGSILWRSEQPKKTRFLQSAEKDKNVPMSSR